ncbi:MAG: NHLP bacteriocin export ABC transporter permease/ATPase subunit [Microscillaceae bacterium]|nr:NHLP bacteriocin export ABC transporter permease/ATPase subunit [Microscillaceae bacterium]MDW8460817.1 NHLP bacteriocin export ABC transporter permease/ATPase subunit [Cytophagales bacterium]
MQALATQIKRVGKEQRLTVNTPFLLDQPNIIWWIEKGNISLYTVELDEQYKPQGKRYYFADVPTGEILLGMNTQTAWKVAFLADATEDTTTWAIPLTEFQSLAQSIDFQADVAKLLQSFIETIYIGIAENTSHADEQADLLVEASEKLLLRKNEKIAAHKQLVWCKVRQVENLYLNGSVLIRPNFENNYYFVPISPKSYIKAQKSVGVQCFSTIQVITEPQVWQSLQFLVPIWFELEKTEIDLVKTREQQSYERKYAFQFAQTQRILQSVSGLLDTTQSTKFWQTNIETTHALFNACQMILQFLNIPIVMPPNLQSSPDALGEIMRFSKVRYREVTLPKNWWQSDNGVLLGFDKQTEEPLAIIPNEKGKYVAYNPTQNNHFEINAQTALQIDKLAYTFYQPLPDKTITISDLLRLAFFNTISDLNKVVGAGLLGTLFTLLVPVLTGLLVDFVIPQADGFQLGQFAFMLLSSSIALILFELTENYALLRIETQMDNRLEAALWDRLLKLPANFFRQYNVGDLAERTKAIHAIRSLLSSVVITTILSGIFSFFNFALLFYYSTALALFALAFTFFEVMLMFFLGRIQIQKEKQMVELEGKMQGITWQMIQGISKFRVMGIEIRALNRWFTMFVKFKKSQIEATRLQNVQSWFNIMLPLIGTLILYGLVMQFALTDKLSTGEFLAFYAAYTAFSASLLAMNEALLSVYQAIPLFERVKPIFTEALEIDNQKANPGILKGDIEVNHVTFRYQPDAPPVLQDISLHIQAGEYVALVGASGSGKSTLIRLLLGFEKPESGSIFYDKQDLSLLDLRLLRQQIGVVLQEGALTPGDILSNIIGSSPHLTIDDAWHAAELAAIADDIRQMPMQMHTIISEGATNLSGGQKQRLLIAQTLVHKPRILIFDEATSALDNHTQAIITQSLSKLQATRIVVAHRLSTIKEVDKIFVFDKGQIVQVGSFEELMAQEGIFRELASRQLE